LVLTAGLKPVNNLSSLFVLQVIREILSESEEACVLAKTFDIYLFLEMNPDGKLLGNSYKSACGVDLSTLTNYSKTLHPELFFFYKAMNEINIKHKIAIFIDFNDNWKK
jgi:murein tripeptide amidase MpaA